MVKQTVPIQINPGFSDGTEYETGASWIKGNLVRWHEGRLKPWKPWRRMFPDEIQGYARGVHFWTASNGMRYLAVATQTNVYLINVIANTLLDITPATGLNTSNTFNIGPGYSGGVYGGSFDYSSAPDIQGLDFSFTDYARWSLDNWGDFLLGVKEADGQIWKFDPTQPYDTTNAATDTVISTADSNIIYVSAHTTYALKSLITGTNFPPDTVVTAIDTTATADGYPITLSRVAYNTESASSITVAAQYELEVITTDSDPLRARGCIVTAERYLMLFGAGGLARRLQWSAAEDYTTFANTTAAPSEAGFLDVSTKGFLMAARKVRAGVLLFSSVDCHLVSYLGPPYIYGIEALADACGPVSSAGIQQIAERTVWLGSDGFWQYDGNVTVLPCPILESFLADLDLQRASLCSAGTIREFGEVVFFYPSKDNSEDRCNAYILWGTRNNTWSMGRLDRDAFLAEEAYVFPIAVGPDPADGNNYIWAHEVDRTVAYEPNVLAYAETGAFEIAQGEQQSRVWRLWHDVKKSGEAGSYPKFKFYRSNSADSEEIEEGPYTPNARGWIDTRWQGRQLRIRVEAPISEEWTLGKQRMEVQPGGTR